MRNWPRKPNGSLAFESSPGLCQFQLAPVASSSSPSLHHRYAADPPKVQSTHWALESHCQQQPEQSLASREQGSTQRTTRLPLQLHCPALSHPIQRERALSWTEQLADSDPAARDQSPPTTVAFVKDQDWPPLPEFLTCRPPQKTPSLQSSPIPPRLGQRKLDDVTGLAAC
ncbi:hypothetical protein PG997_005514 [Apiospora hydei]|uniref:Uncharacterized protein n=1 Tax=Apiospora hydei TaxID=1337664 RepID=A0ABR1WQF4_9PEZI